MGKNTSLPVYDREGQHENTSVTMESPGQSGTSIGVDTLEGNVEVKIADLEVQISELKSDLAKVRKDCVVDRNHRKSEIKALQEQLSMSKNDLEILREQIVNRPVAERTSCGCNNEVKVLREQLETLQREFEKSKRTGPLQHQNLASIRQVGSRPYCAFAQPNKFIGRSHGNANAKQGLQSTPIDQQPRPGLPNKKQNHKTYPPGRERSALSDSSEPSGNHLSTSTPDEVAARSPAQKRPIPVAPTRNNEAAKRPKQMRPIATPQEVDAESVNSDNEDAEVVINSILNATAHRVQQSSSTSDDSETSNALEEYGKGVYDAGMRGWKPLKITPETKTTILREMTTVENMHRITMANCQSAIEDSIWPDILRKALPDATETKLKELVDYLASTSRRSSPFIKLILQGIIKPHDELCRKCPK